MALVIVAAAFLAWRFAAFLGTVAAEGNPSEQAQQLSTSGHSVVSQPALGPLWGAPVIVVSMSLLLVLLGTGEALFRVLGVRPTPMPPPIPAPRTGGSADLP